MTAAAHRCRTLVMCALLLLSTAACQNQPGDGGDTRLSTAAGDMLAAAQDPTSSTSSQVGGGSQVSLGTPAPPPSQEEATDIARLGFDQGSPDAPVRIVEFSDYGCGFCRKFHIETWPTLKTEYIDAGKVLWKTVPFVIGNWANSVPASLASECAAGQGKAEQITQLLFERQSEWKGVSRPEAPIATIAAAAGVNMLQYQRCLDDSTYLWRVQAHTSLAQQVGVRGTPAFFVIGYAPVQGALPLELFREVIDTALADTEAAGR